MRRLRIILASVFLAGVLLGGVGAGIAMVEWSSLEYGGRKLLGSEHMVTEDLDFELADDDSRVILEYSYYTDRYLQGIEEDPSVPENVIRYQVTYNEALVEPYLHYNRYDTADTARKDVQETVPEDAAEAETAPVYCGELRLMRTYFGDEFEILMEYKDDILNELKAGILSSYDIVEADSVKIKVNPATMARVEDRTK